MQHLAGGARAHLHRPVGLEAHGRAHQEVRHAVAVVVGGAHRVLQDHVVVRVREAPVEGQARGAAIVAGTHAELPVFEYTALQIKQSVVGTGAADKSQVQHMVKVLLKLPGVPREDAADALACALCHVHTQQSSGSRFARLTITYARWLFEQGFILTQFHPYKW